LHGIKIIPEAGRDEKATLNLRPPASNIRKNLHHGEKSLIEESHQSDTAPIRAGEELDFNALEKYLRLELKTILPEVDLDCFEMEFRQFPGGHSNLTYLVHLGPREFVLRRPPFGPVAPTAHDMPREYKLLAAINPVFGLAPRPYLLCEDTAIIGVPFYLMERRRGFVIRREMPAEIEDSLDLRRSISESLVDTLAALHRVDIHPTGLAGIGKPVGFVTRQVRGWADRWLRSKISEVPEIDEIIAWLLDRLPPEPDESRPATLVHNDFKLDNVMLDYSDPARVVAVLDWEMCTVGDPLVDLGILLCYWPEKNDPEARRDSISSVTTEPGWMTRAEIIHRYAEKTGRDLSGIKFYEVFAIFKIAVVIQQIYFRYLRGQTRDERFAGFGARVEGLARAAMGMTE
jgi:aminoglycoside phosphotransferase (APT) family kinase protein